MTKQEKQLFTVIIGLIGTAFFISLIIVVPGVVYRRQRRGAELRLATAKQLLASNRLEDAFETLETIDLSVLSDDDQGEAKDLQSSTRNEVQRLRTERQAMKSAAERQHVEQLRRERLARQQETERTLAIAAGIGIWFVVTLLVATPGFLVVGLGQLFAAFRDMAVNSYLSVSHIEAGSVHRTPVVPGALAPRYSFIPIISIVLYIVGGFWIGCSFAWPLFLGKQ